MPGISLMSVELEIVDDPGHACAAMMVGEAAGGGHVVLTGGSTPRVAYEEFARTVAELEIDLSATHLWFGDERCVGPEDERSNYRMVREALLRPPRPRPPAARPSDARRDRTPRGRRALRR